MAPAIELPKNLWNRQSRRSQAAQNVAFVFHESATVGALPVGFALGAPFFYHDRPRRRSRKIKRFVDAAFSPLRNDFVNQVVRRERPQPKPNWAHGVLMKRIG